MGGLTVLNQTSINEVADGTNVRPGERFIALEATVKDNAIIAGSGRMIELVFTIGSLELQFASGKAILHFVLLHRF